MAVLECEKPGDHQLKTDSDTSREKIDKKIGICSKTGPEGKVVEDGGDKDMFADEGGENTGMEAKEVEESEDDETIDATQQK